MELALAAAGAALPQAFAPAGYWGLAPPLLALAAAGSLAASPRRAFLRGWLFGFCAYAPGMAWVRISIHEYGGLPAHLALLLALLLNAFLALFPAAAFLGTRLAVGPRTAPGALVLAFPACWTLGEWCRTWVLTGFPWLALGYSQIDSPLRGYAPVLGVLGVGWVVLTCGTLLAVLPGLLKVPGQRQAAPHGVPGKPSFNAAAAVLALCAMLFAGGTLLERRTWSEPDGAVLGAALVQGAEPQTLYRNVHQARQLLDRYLRLSEADWDRLLIWPESALPTLPEAGPPVLEEPARHLQEQGGLLVTGLLGEGTEHGVYHNSVLALDGRANAAVYHKRHLVPFGEYTPLAHLLVPLMRRLGFPVSGLIPGNPEARPLLRVGELRLGVSICYEDLFGAEFREALPEAQLLINISNDGWFGDSAAPWQHLQIARMRALESGRFLLRATNSGISAVIGPGGELRQQLPLFTTRVLRTEVPLLRGATPYVQYGDRTVLLLCLLSLGLVAALRCRPTAGC